MKPLDVVGLADGVRKGQRAAMGRAITLLESARASDRPRADALLAALLPHSGGAHRVGITGSPGVGKSTLIEALGTRLTADGHRVAVLAVDPSSEIAGGSILGDKTRMAGLARDPNAFIRPSPAGTTLGGVARRTRESIVVCEAAGFDVVLVETVGVGQSEAMVAGMVDFFLVLALAGGGDELQGIKRGILELADAVAITKADGANTEPARRSRHEYSQAMTLMVGRRPEWKPRTLTCSAQTGEGLDTLWRTVVEHRTSLMVTGSFERQRSEQNLQWMWQAVESGLLAKLRDDPGVSEKLTELRDEVLRGRVAPDRAAAILLDTFLGR